MNSKYEIMLIECHILLSEAIKGYEDRAFMSNKLFEVRQYSNKLPSKIYEKINTFIENNISPMIYDVDYWAFLERNEDDGNYDSNNHFILKSDSAIENIIFRKYNHVNNLLEELNDFMSKEFQLNYDC